MKFGFSKKHMIEKLGTHVSDSLAYELLLKRCPSDMRNSTGTNKQKQVLLYSIKMHDKFHLKSCWFDDKCER